VTIYSDRLREESIRFVLRGGSADFLGKIKDDTMMNDIQKLIDANDEPTAPTGVKMTEPKLLSECGTLLVVDGTPGEQYQIEIAPGDYLIVRAGATVNKPSARFSHPNVAAFGKVLHEFKHYGGRNGCRKFWTAHAGMDFYFVIPRSAVKMLPVKGHSYIPAEINGVKVTFNVSGGTANGWTDWLHTNTTIAVNHKLSDLKKIAEVAVRNSPFEPMVVKPLEDETRWNQLAARASKGLVEKIAKLAEDGKFPVVKFLPGFEEKEGKVVSVNRRAKKTMLPHGNECLKKWSTDYTGAVKSLVLVVDRYGCRIRAKIGQIDWFETAKANGIAA